MAMATALGDVGLLVAARNFRGEIYHWTLADYGQAAALFRRNVDTLHGARRWEHFGTAVIQSVYARARLAECLAE
jgi:hypothetical protein